MNDTSGKFDIMQASDVKESVLLIQNCVLSVQL